VVVVDSVVLFCGICCIGLSVVGKAIQAINVKQTKTRLGLKISKSDVTRLSPRGCIVPQRVFNNWFWMHIDKGR